jgi:hypothetical protein
MGLLPFLYFMIFFQPHKIIAGQRIKTNQLGRKGVIVSVTPSHSFIEFDDESQAWYRNEMITTED